MRNGKGGVRRTIKKYCTVVMCKGPGLVPAAAYVNINPWFIGSSYQCTWECKVARDDERLVHYRIGTIHGKGAIQIDYKIAEHIQVGININFWVAGTTCI